MHAAYFDMDGTLLKGDSNDCLTQYLLSVGVIDQSFIDPLQDFHLRYLRGQLHIEDFVYYIIKPFIGMEATRRSELVEGCLKHVLLPRLRPGGIAEIKRQQAAGAAVMIVSSTVDFLIEPIARHLGVELTAAAPLEYDEQGRVTGEIAGLVPYQEQKVRRIKALLNAHGLSNEGSSAYGDSINDLQMLCFASRGFLVHPSPELTARPESRAFTLLNWD